MTLCRFEHQTRCEWNYNKPDSYCVSTTDLCLHCMAIRLQKLEEEKRVKND